MRSTRYYERKTRYSWPVVLVGRVMFGVACVLLFGGFGAALNGAWLWTITLGAAGLALIVPAWRLKGGARLAVDASGSHYRIVDKRGDSRYAKWYQ